MKAFVKTNNGTFPNVNFYLAWEAFNTMGYSVTCFEEQDIPTLDVTPATPVFAGITVFKKIIDKLEVPYPPFNCYPDSLKNFYGRTLRRSTLGEERAKFNRDGVQVFVKPVLPKQFIGQVWTSMISLIPIANVPDDAEVWVCEPIDIISEFRAYIHDGDILGVKHYYGDWNSVANKLIVEDAVKQYVNAPIAYGIDFAVVGHQGNPNIRNTVVLETNDGCNLGNYGLDSIHYGEMIVDRWFEIMAMKPVQVEINEQIEYFKGTAYESEYNQEKYDKLLEGCSKSRKQLMVKSNRISGKEASMRAFAEEVKQQLRERSI